jgi:peptide/nickel transport system permease protein
MMPRNLKLGVGLLIAWVVLAILGPILIGGDPTEMDLGSALLPPSLQFPFGTDSLGRGVLTRVVFGTQIDLQIGLFTVAPAFIIGTIIGTLAGYFGGALDILAMRLVDIAVAFPFLVAVIAIVAVLGPGLINMYIAVACVGWVSYARIARAEILVVKTQDYVQAARLLDLGDRRVLFGHILPNVIVQSLVYASSDVILGIFLGSSLGFLGLGAQPPQPEWGLIIADGYGFVSQAPWIGGFPGLAIVLLAISFSLLGDGLADALRPELVRA